jgi:hypothetical protein
LGSDFFVLFYSCCALSVFSVYPKRCMCK